MRRDVLTMNTPLNIQTTPRERISDNSYTFGDIRLDRVDEYLWSIASITFSGGTNLRDKPVITILNDVDAQPQFNIEQDNEGTITSISILDGGLIRSLYSNMPPTYALDGTPLDQELVIHIENNNNFQQAIGDNGLYPLMTGLSACGYNNSNRIDDSLNSLKSSLASAVNASGLNDLLGQLNKYKSDLLNNLPSAPEPIRFDVEFASLLSNITDIEYVSRFQARWGDVVPDLDDILGSVTSPDFNICDIQKRNIQATVDSNGNLKERAVAPDSIIPQGKPQVSTQTSDIITTERVEETATGAFEVKFNITAAEGQAGLQLWRSSIEKLWSIINRTETAEASSGLINLKAQKDYQIFLQLRADNYKKKNRRINRLKIQEFEDLEKEYIPVIYKSKSEKKLLQKSIDLLQTHIAQNCIQYLNTLPEYPREAVTVSVSDRNLGAYLYGTSAIYGSGLYEHDVLVVDSIQREFASVLWNKETVRSYCRYLLSRQEEGINI